MKINTNENIILVDVDSTLVFSTDKVFTGVIQCDYYGQKKYVTPHLEHIKLIKSYKARGFYIRVHSNNGYLWAKEVVTKLDLTKYIDSIESKPTRFIDDAELPSNEVIGQRVWIKP